MTVLLTGWSGHALASTRGGWAHPVDVPRSTRRPGGEIGYIVRRAPEGTLRLTVSLGESVFSKAVSSTVPRLSP